MKYIFQSVSDQGAYRDNNEDAIRFAQLEKHNLAWMVIADGMGGHLAGEVASQILVDTVETEMARLINQNNPQDWDKKQWCDWISSTLQIANSSIHREAQQNASRKGMGTTAVLLVTDGEQAYIGWVGDSRAYLYRMIEQQPRLTQLTRDHTMIQALLDKGAISEKEALQSNQKNMLSKALGVSKQVQVDCICQAVQALDILLLSTDGLHDSLSEESLIMSLLQIAKEQPVAYQLVEQSITAGSKDNITFGSILLRNE